MGVVIVNPGGVDAAVVITAYGTGGGILSSGQAVVPAGQRLGFLTSALLPNLDPGVEGWFQAVSDVSGLTGFFLFLNSDPSELDGADLPIRDRDIVFNKIQIEGDLSTELNIVNPGSTSIQVNLTLIGAANPVEKVLNLAALGSARFDVATFFGVNEVAPGAYVVVNAPTDVFGFEFIQRQGADLQGLNARSAEEFLNTLYFAQMAVLGPFEAELGLVNYSSQSVIVVATAHRPDGSLFIEETQRNPVTIALGPGGSDNRDLESLFGFQGDEVLEGWLEVTANTEAINGQLTYRVVDSGAAAAVAVVPQGSKASIFAHVATTLGFFTGLAVLNAAALPATVEIAVLDSEGVFVGGFTTVLNPGVRISQLITELVPESADLAGGFIWLRSNVPLFLSALFGSVRGDVLANVPAQDVSQVFDPTGGALEIKINPPLAVLSPTNAQGFSVQGGSGAVAWAVNDIPGGSAQFGTISGTGVYTAPAIVVPDLPITVSARTGNQSAAAGVDLISEQELVGDLGIVQDWRQLEFPATTNGIPRFFRADPDHEGMVKDQQVRRLVKLKKNEKTLTMAAAKAGMSRKTARKYLKSGKLPSQCQPERYWRTRSDPFESVWPEVKEILKRSPTVEAKAVFDHLCRQQEGAFQQGQLRTLQRRIKQWKAEYGEAKEVMFPQKYQPGHQAQSDFTFMGRLGVTIQGQPFPHLLYHFVLAYSNWEATTLCFSESFESLSLGLQNALWELGALPEEHRTDRLSAAVKNLKREEFTERYQALLRHFGMRSSRTQAGKAHENGDVEQSHHRLKRAIEQELLLRCSRDFSSREEYEGFVAVIVSRRNAARQKRLGEELAVMRPLPARRLDDFTRQWVRVSPSSTIRVRHNTYSVDSRLIGERVQVRVWADQVEVYYGGRRQARMPRLRGEGKHRIDYRHVIHSLVRKPGAFTRYRWREDLFPGILFRVAYDELRRDCPATADRQYLKILEVAAQEGEQRVREALQVLIERGQRIRFEALRECLVDPVVEPWEVMVEKMDVGLYDTLLENREVRS